MEKYRLVIFPAAKLDLNEIVDYVNGLSPESALRVYDNIISKIGSLERVPRRCPPVKNSALRVRGYRALRVDNYLVFYVIEGKRVEIRRILHDRREYETVI